MSRGTDSTMWMVFRFPAIILYLVTKFVPKMLVKKVKKSARLNRGFHNTLLETNGHDWKILTITGAHNKEVTYFGSSTEKRELVTLSQGPLGPSITSASYLPLGRFTNFTFSTCYPNKFTCASGHCVPLE